MSLQPERNHLISVPYGAMEELLLRAGVNITPEAYLLRADITHDIACGVYLKKRTVAAKWSSIWLATAASFAVVSLPFSFGFVSAVVSCLLVGLTLSEAKVYFELRKGHADFLEVGFWNQCAFAAFFLLYYGIFQAISVAPVSSELTATVPGITDAMVNATVVLFRSFYIALGVFGCAGQLWLACFYRSGLRFVNR